MSERKQADVDAEAEALAAAAAGGPLRDWLVGGAVIEGPDGFLLVRNRRRDGSHDWTPPGGVIDAGEPLLDGLTREVEEETGLVVREWSGPLYEVIVEAPGLGWRLRVEAWLATDIVGTIRVGDDPDGIVVEARYVDAAECLDHLVGGHPWVREPFTEWIADRWIDTRPYRYALAGADRASFTVTRHD